MQNSMLHRGDWTPLPYHHPTSPRSHIFTLSFNSAHYIYLGNTTSTFTLHLGSIAYLGDRFSQNSGQCATQQITQDLITPDNNKRWTESFFTSTVQPVGSSDFCLWKFFGREGPVWGAGTRGREEDMSKGCRR
jgi:hypothetical protein